MHKTIIADTSCFIVLANIDELDLLHKVYGRIVTTFEVAAEYGETLPALSADEAQKPAINAKPKKL
jgi:predicted nucleic acid-binding protein